MRAYIIRRLLAIIPTVLLATLIVFFVIRLVPGHIIDLMISQHDVSADTMSREKIKAALGLDVPIHVQYTRWMGNLFIHGDLGHSLWRETSVWREVRERGADHL